MLLVALLVAGCWQETGGGPGGAASREEVEASSAQNTRVVLGFTPREDFEQTDEGKALPLAADATYHVDLQLLDAATGEHVADVHDVSVTISNPRGDQETQTLNDNRVKYGHFCQGFFLEPKKQYQITVNFRGPRTGASVALFHT